MLKPLRRIANSEAFAGRASKATATAHKNAAALGATLAAVSVANGPIRIIFFDRSQADTDRGSAKLINDDRFDLLPTQHVLHGGGYTALGVRAGKRPAAGAQLLGRIPHDKGVAGESKHFNIVIVIANGHDLLAGNAAVVGPALERVSLGTAGIEHIDNGKIAARVLSAHNRDGQAAAFEDLQYPLHERDRAAKHGLHGISGERILDRNHELNVLHIFFQPALDAAFQFVQTLDHDGARSIAVEIVAVKSENGLAAKLLHRADEFAAGRRGEQVAVESFAGKGAGDSVIITDQPEIKSQLLSDGQGKDVAASSNQDDLDGLGMCTPEG